MHRPPDRTDSTSSSEDRIGDADAGVDHLALVLVADGEHVADAGKLIPLEGVASVGIGRGDARGVEVATVKPLRLSLTLPDRKVSSSHATITVSGRRVRVRDEGSTNGTFVDDVRVTGEVDLPPHVALRVGHTLLVLLDDANPMLGGRAWPFPTTSGAFARDLKRLERVAPSALPVILLGETGSGKEVVARAVHERSGRSGGFLAVNCAALPQHLVEAQLFGHVKGAFSGAVRDEPGFFRSADRGTLLLDEVGDLPAASQAALLRTLQEGEVTPVGAVKPTRVDVRVIAATHQDLEGMVRDGRFRADLFARLSGFVFRVPPLRERRADLGFLAAGLLEKEGLSARIRPDALVALYRYGWPLNVRELGKVLTAGVHLSEDGVVRLEQLPPHITTGRAPTGSALPPSAPLLDTEDAALRDDLLRRLEATGYNVSQVARDMGKARQQVQRWMRRFGLRERA